MLDELFLLAVSIDIDWDWIDSSRYLSCIVLPAFIAVSIVNHADAYNFAQCHTAKLA